MKIRWVEMLIPRSKPIVTFGTSIREHLRVPKALGRASSEGTFVYMHIPPQERFCLPALLEDVVIGMTATFQIVYWTLANM